MIGRIAERARALSLAVVVILVARLEVPRVQASETLPGGGILYEGVLDLEGHYARPHITRRYSSEQRFWTNNLGDVRLDWTTWVDGDTTRVPESFLFLGSTGLVLIRSDPASGWRELTGVRAEQTRLQVLAGLPIPLVLRAGDLGLEIRRQESRVLSATIARAHPRLGDVRDSIAYHYASDTSRQPDGFRMSMQERDHGWTLETRRIPGVLQAPDSLFAIGPTYEPGPANPDSLTGKAVLVPIAEGVWAIDMEDIESRSLVVEFEDSLALIEAAVGSANGERIVDAVRTKWPNKRIGYAFVSHHHPHYTGGLRALMAEGATIVTTPGNAALMQEIANYPFRIAPDRLARAPRPAVVRTFDARFELVDGKNQIVAVNIGKRSQHTDEFVIFWLPRAKLLFESEQGWVSVDGTLRASRRAPELLKILADENLEVDRLVQSWPMRNEPREVSRTELESLVRARQASGTSR